VKNSGFFNKKGKISASGKLIVKGYNLVNFRVYLF